MFNTRRVVFQLHSRIKILSALKYFSKYAYVFHNKTTYFQIIFIRFSQISKCRLAKSLFQHLHTEV